MDRPRLGQTQCTVIEAISGGSKVGGIPSCSSSGGADGGYL